MVEYLHKYCSWILRDSHQCSEQLKQQCVAELQKELRAYNECYQEGCKKGFQEHPVFVSIKQDIDEMETALNTYKQVRQKVCDRPCPCQRPLSWVEYICVYRGRNKRD